MLRKDSLLLVLFLTLIAAPILILLVGGGAVVAIANAHELERKVEDADSRNIPDLTGYWDQLTLRDVIRRRIMSMDWVEEYRYYHRCQPCGGYKVRTISRGGVVYRWVTNTEQGSYHHAKYIKLASEGYPIIFDEEAYNVYGRIVEDSVAVFVAANSVSEVQEASQKFVDADRLHWAKIFAWDGLPASLYREFIKTGELRGEEARRLLARAFERSAERDGSMAEQAGKGSSSGQLFLEDARLKWELARRLRAGEQVEGIMVEYFAYSAD